MNLLEAITGDLPLNALYLATDDVIVISGLPDRNATAAFLTETEHDMTSFDVLQTLEIVLSVIANLYVIIFAIRVMIKRQADQD